MDEMKIKTDFMGSLIGKVVVKILEKKLGIEPGTLYLAFRDISIAQGKGVTNGEATVRFTIPSEELKKLILQDKED